MKIPKHTTITQDKYSEYTDDTIHTNKFYPRVTQLKNLIKYFWVFECRNINLCHKILPVNNIDIIINFLSPMIFEKNGISSEIPSNIFFRGLTKEYTTLKQHGAASAIGVSFFPAGFYPFFKIPVSEFKNGTFGLDIILRSRVHEIEEKLIDTATISEKIDLLENFFLELLDPNARLSVDSYKQLHFYYSSNLSIHDFCLRNSINPRTFERFFNKYIGTPPKSFYRLSRFQSILNKLINRKEVNLATLAHEFDFFDQSHFIKDFESFTGCPPSIFMKENQAIKQILV
ncbi:AraC family transcriptional regulator [Desulfovibrio inopinatus]|uniref:AraC family transcriptional regulator n=1 Tax=Desulfovibrio inopinatus TaxID=102109 RepID=UPI0004037643|nr:helix-turn-helix domain-containing protein [Desulfovibrio inopinatus]